MDTLLQDLRYGARTLARARGFVSVAVLTLALGIGGTTAIYSIVDAILLNPLPYPDAGRLVVPRSLDVKTGDDWSVTHADFVDWRDAGVFEQVAVYQNSEMDLAGGGDPTRVNVTGVTGQFFATLGIGATRGRLLNAGDNALDGDNLVVLSDGIWRSHFGADSAIVGKTIRMNGLVRTVIGVLAPRVEWPAQTDVWVPIRITNPGSIDFTRRDNFVYQSIARLALGQTIESTRARLGIMAKQVEANEPVVRKDVTITVVTATAALLGDTLPRILWLLLGAVGLVLLISCVNIANLMLARSGARQRELAVRTALGASRIRLVRQILTESALLASMGGILGTFVAIGFIRVLVAASPADVPRITEVGVSYSILAAAMVLSLGCAFLFGLIPALQASATRPGSALGDSSHRLAGGRRARRGRSALVIVELALALMLLTGAGLLTRSLIRLQSSDPGFETGQVTTVSIALPSYAGARYADRNARRDFYTRALERLQTIPGVESASMASALPLGAGGFYLGRAFLAEGWAEPPASTEVQGGWNSIAPRFFETLHMRVIRGRDFTPRDDTASAPVMIINASFAERMFPGENPIGKRVQSWRDERVFREVVGVVDDVRYEEMDDVGHPLVYVPYAQDAFGRMRLVIRTSGDPAGIISAARREVSALDPEVALALVSSMDAALGRSLAGPRFTAYLLTGFATMALLLVAIGLYGVLAYGIAQRTHEIGIRMALGARACNVLGMVVREAVVLVVLGVVIGLAGSLGVARVVASLLYETSATEPTTMAAVVGVLVVVGALAAWIPARRAARVDPMIALREGN